MGIDKLSGTTRIDHYEDVADCVQIDPETRPSAIGPPFTGHFRIQADTPRAIQAYQPTFKPEKAGTSPRITHAKKEPTPHSRLNLEIGRNIYDQSGKEVSSTKDKKANGDDATSSGRASAEASTKVLEDIAKENKKACFCSSCGIDCTRVRYHFAKQSSSAAGTANSNTQYDICPACFVHHRYPHENLNYEKLEDPDYSRVPDRDSPWSDKEVLLLLEALEEDSDDWNRISDYVGTRTREECVVKFLSMEIEDKYLESEPDTFGALDAGRVPFNQSDNPVMSVVSFLAGMADPSVAAATAGRWVDETRKNLQQRLENGVGGQTIADTTTGAEGKGKTSSIQKLDLATASDAMDVDQNTSSPQASDSNAIARHDASKTSNPLPTLALAASAARASALASNEERQHTQLISAALNSSLQKLELKLKQFREMEEMLELQRQDLERGRRELFLERASFSKRMMDVETQLAGMGIGSMGEGVSVAGLDAGGGEKLGFANSKVGRGDGEPMELGAAGVKSHGAQ